jgi:FkbM family methyltransferase
MLKEYLKHSSVFSPLLGPLAKLRSKLRLADPATAVGRYREVVVGGNVILRPRNIPGFFEVSATSDLASRIVLTGSYEPDVTAVLSKLPLDDGVIINVGANVGFYSVYLAATFPDSAKILAIEPNPEAFGLLKENIVRNGLESRISAIQTCIGEFEGKIELSIIDGMPEYSSVGGIIHPGVANRVQIRVEVPVVPLSTLVGTNSVSLIFVDTEGAELSVFAGAEEILLRDRPLLFFECSDTLLKKFGGSSRQLENKLRSLGYIVRNGLCQTLPLQHPFEGEAIALAAGNPH